MNKRGFTLIELMVVLAIIGVLSAIAIPSYINYIRKARVAEATENLQTIHSYQEAYYSNALEYTCLAKNPSTFPVGGDRQNFNRNLSGWSTLGTPIAHGQPLYFQYQAWAIKLNSLGTAPITGDTQLCIENASANLYSGTGYCSNLAELMTRFSNLGFMGDTVEQRANRSGVVITAVADQDRDRICSYFMIYTYKNDFLKRANTDVILKRNELE